MRSGTGARSAGWALGMTLLCGVAAEAAVFSTNDISMTVGGDGKVTSLVDLVTGVERVKSSIPAHQWYVCAVWAGGQSHDPTGYSISGNLLTYTFGTLSGPPVVTVEITTAPRYMTFRVQSVTNGAAIEELRFVHLSTRDSLDRTADRLMRYNDNGQQRFWGLYQLDEYTETQVGPAGAGGFLYAIARSDLALSPGLVGRKAALFACNTDKSSVISTVQTVESAHGIPLGMAAKQQPALRESMIFWAQYTYADRQRMIEVAQEMGMRRVLLFRDSWADPGNQYAPSENWPSYAAIKSWVQQCNAAGQLVGAHALATIVPVDSDAYVFGGVDPGLRRDLTLTLAADLPAGQTTGLIQTTTPPTGWPVAEGQRDVVIGQELIEYTSVNATAPPYGLVGPFVRAKNQTGPGGLGPRDHVSGATIGRLVISGDFTSYQLDLAGGGIAGQIAEIAGAVKASGFNFVYSDGMEEIEPPHWYTTGLVVSMYYNELVALNATPLWIESSSHVTGYMWPLVAVFGQIDYYVHLYDYKAEVDRNISHLSPDPLNPDPRQIGWAPICHPNIGGQTRPDELEYLLAKSAAYGYPIVVVLWAVNIDDWINRDANFALIKKYEQARLAGTIPSAERELAKQAGRDFMLFTGENGEHHLLRVSRLQIGDGSAAVRGYISDKNAQGKRYATLWPTGAGSNLRLRLAGLRPQDVVARDTQGALLGSSVPGPGQVSIPLSSRIYVRLENVADATRLFADARIE